MAFHPITNDHLALMPRKILARVWVADHSNLTPKELRGIPVTCLGRRVVLAVELYPWCPWPKPNVLGDLFGGQDAWEYVFVKWW